MAQKRSTSKSTRSRSTTPTRATKSSTPRKSTRGSTTGARRPAPQARPWLSPQQQREMFAFVLIGLGLLLFVLFISTNRGVVGEGVIGFIQTAFGNGGIVLPFLLLIVGGLILWQERFVDAPVTGGNIVGVLTLALTLLSFADFGMTRQIFEDGLDAPRSIGGAFDLLLMQALGIAGTLVVLTLIFVIGVMLTFNVTLRQIFGRVRVMLIGLWNALRGPIVEEVDPDEALKAEPVPYADELKTKRAPRPPLNALPPSKLPDEPQQQTIYTPLAARPTQASLFQRPDSDKASTGETIKLPAQAAPTAQPAPPAKRVSPTDATQPIAVQPATAAAKPGAAKQPPVEEDSEIAEVDIGGARQAWPLPAVSMLEDFDESEIDDREKSVKARIIEHTLASFKIEAAVREAKSGPAVTQYLLQPAIGVKVSRITGLERDLALALAAPSVRIEAPVPGTSYIGIEIPNTGISSVSMKEVIDTEEYRRHKGRLRLALGKDVSGTPVITDLTKAPHLLIAGSTGSGKSVAVNSIVCTLLMNNTPDDLKFIMVDPKMVELIVYNNIPHLLAPVVTELERVISLLKWAVREMERRYKLLAQKGYRNIDAYNKAARAGGMGLEPLPYVVIIIDELADLMMMAPDEVETLICRLAQMARAIGIHLILATQRPSVDVVTGLIKANFPTRVAFAVTSQIDSRVILDQSGAEHLLGKGDMLYLASDAPKPIRVQGTYVSDHEIEEITRFWRAENVRHPREGDAPGKPLPLRPAAGGEPQTAQVSVEPDAVGVSPLPDGHAGLNADEQDELLPKAIKLVRQHDRASASLLQRRLRIGYSKAAQLIDLLEQQGIVGPAEGSRSREVLDRDGDLASADDDA